MSNAENASDVSTTGLAGHRLHNPRADSKASAALLHDNVLMAVLYKVPQEEPLIYRSKACIKPGKWSENLFRTEAPGVIRN